MLPLLRSPPFPGIKARTATIGIMHGDRRSESMTAAVEDAAALVDAIRTARVGGTFWAPTPIVPDGPIILLRPQSRADTATMAIEALNEAVTEQVIAVLPDVRWAAGARRYLAKLGVTVTVGDVDPWPLLRADTHILAHGDDEYVLLAQIAGAGVSVRSPGRFAPASPRRAPTVAGRAFADLAVATRYRDPMSGATIAPLAAVSILANWRRTIDANRGLAVATGMAVWKRTEINRMLWAGRTQPLRFVRTAAAAVRAAERAGGAIATWPSRNPPGLVEAAAAAAVPVHTIEDGFIRSVGLGAACVPPLSIAVDRRGIHYDPSRPSDLEVLLAETTFDPALLARADALIAFVIAQGIGKYGADGTTTAATHRPPAGRRRVLVTGQVVDDLSVLLGGAGVAGNLDLIARVRAVEPDAEIWYRPHPDVDAGLRNGAVPDSAVLDHADAVMRGGAMATLFDQVDGVHVLTSLAGFEALLRGRDVTVHGQPFYAGWGLTRDLAPPIVRRQRRLTIAELVAAVLILYPRYLDPVTGLPCEPERMTEQMVRQTVKDTSVLTKIRGLQGWIRRNGGKGVLA